MSWVPESSPPPPQQPHWWSLPWSHLSPLTLWWTTGWRTFNFNYQTSKRQQSADITITWLPQTSTHAELLVLHEKRNLHGHQNQANMIDIGVAWEKKLTCLHLGRFPCFALDSRNLEKWTRGWGQCWSWDPGSPPSLPLWFLQTQLTLQPWSLGWLNRQKGPENFW